MQPSKMVGKTCLPNQLIPQYVKLLHNNILKIIKPSKMGGAKPIQSALIKHNKVFG